MSPSIFDEIMMDYFPFTEKCPQDGKPCLKNKCKYWVEEKVCWDIEFENLVSEMFNCERHDYIRYELENPGIDRFYLKSELWIENREDFSTPPKIVIEIGVSSERLAQKLKKQFNLNQWEIQGRCEDGGDDHDLVMVTHASHIEKNEIKKLLETVKEMIPKMIKAEKEINTCHLCKGRASSLTEYGDNAICYGCEKRIIVENLPNYMLKA